MATLGSPTSPSSPRRRKKAWARKVERFCCSVATFFPLVFVYGLTSWAVWVEVKLGLTPSELWTGKGSSFVGALLYILLNWSYTTAVFTDPGSPLETKHGYSHLPTQENRPYSSFTVKSTGEIRFCKKCRTKKPDRAHHCSTCKRCVLKMDHHCPWLATCVGLHNYKAFLLFLIYLTLFCWICFAVSATWVWTDVLRDAGADGESLMPVNYIMLAVLSGIIGIVIAGFTAWHLYLVSINTTTIEKLEKTRYLSPLRKSMQHHLSQRNPMDPATNRPSISDQLREIHANVLPGITRPEEGMDSRSTTPQPPHLGSNNHHDPSAAHNSLRRTYYQDIEAQRARANYSDYLDEADSAKMPHAFDLGWRRNYGHVFGPVPWLWFVPVCNTTGDGWLWEASETWVLERDQLRVEREAQMRLQRERERAAGWGVDSPVMSPRVGTRPAWAAGVNDEDDDDDDMDDAEGWKRNRNDRFLTTSNGVARIPGEGRRSPGKANQILGRWAGDPGAGAGVSSGNGVGPAVEEHGTQMQVLDRRRMDPYRLPTDDEYDTSSDEERTERKAFLKNHPPPTSQRAHSSQRNAPKENWNDLPDDMISRSKKGKGDERKKNEQDWDAWSPR